MVTYYSPVLIRLKQMNDLSSMMESLIEADQTDAGTRAFRKICSELIRAGEDIERFVVKNRKEQEDVANLKVTKDYLCVLQSSFEKMGGPLAESMVASIKELLSLYVCHC